MVADALGYGGLFVLAAVISGAAIMMTAAVLRRVGSQARAVSEASGTSST